MSEWHPIATAPEGEHILLWFPEGERGVGGMECGTLYRTTDGSWDTGAWTHGGPNSGTDWEMSEMPTHWRRLPPPPDAAQPVPSPCAGSGHDLGRDDRN